jgi:hypothetical protein
VRTLLLFIPAAAALAADPSADEIVRKALARDQENWLAARNYTFLERQVRRTFSEGRVAGTRIRTYDVTMQDGSPYRRLIAENDQPLDAKRQRDEEEKLRKSIAARQSETGEQRQKRLAQEEKDRAREREFTNEIPAAFDLKLAGSGRLSGRDCWIIEGTPKADYRPRARTARVFPSLKGRLWIDKQDYGLVRGEAEVIRTISYGLFLARIHAGTKVTFEQARINQEVWLPHRIYAQVAGRLGLIKKLDLDLDIAYRDYKKFQAESRITSVSAGPASR